MESFSAYICANPISSAPFSATLVRRPISRRIFALKYVASRDKVFNTAKDIPYLVTNSDTESYFGR